MQIEKISYHKTFNLGNYSNEKIGLDIIISKDDNPLEAFAEAKKQVEKSHKFFQEMPAYESAKRVLNDYDNHTGREIKAAEQLIKVFEENYPDFMSHFMPSRQLTESPVRDVYGYDEDEDDDR